MKYCNKEEEGGGEGEKKRRRRKKNKKREREKEGDRGIIRQEVCTRAERSGLAVLYTSYIAES